MKLFFLLIPFLGINCLMKCLHENNRPAPVQKEVVSYPIMPSGLLIQFN
ncbi:MAG: hypothetical protein ACJ75B_13820 [Flavisolibacter sp.]